MALRAVIEAGSRTAETIAIKSFRPNANGIGSRARQCETAAVAACDARGASILPCRGLSGRRRKEVRWEPAARPPRTPEQVQRIKDAWPWLEPFSHVYQMAQRADGTPFGPIASFDLKFWPLLVTWATMPRADDPWDRAY